MSHNSFGKVDWAALRRAWNMWWEGTLERPLVMYEHLDPGWSREIQMKKGLSELPSLSNLSFTGQFGLDTPVDQVIQYYQDQLDHIVYYGDAFPKLWVNYGPGLVAAFLGADFQIQSDTIWLSPPQSENGISWEEIPLIEISLTFNAQHPLWQRVCELTKAAEDQFGESICVGITDLGGNLDILASLIGSTRLAMEMLDNPDEVARLCEEIRQVWLDCYDQLKGFINIETRGSTCWAAVWAPERYYMFQSDFAYMISPEMFKRFVVPDLKMCAETIPYAFYHLDGKGQIRHVDQLLALDGLRGIQWIPGDGAPPPEEWLSLLEKIIAGDKRCQLYVSAEGARRIVNELGGKGFALYINDDLSPTEAEVLIKELCGE